MKKTTATIIGLTTTLLAAAPIVFAESSVTISNNGEGSQSNVNVQSSTGNNTICVNGKCTTSEGSTGRSTVCINGKCETSEGEIHMEQEGAKVDIKNNTSEVKLEQKSSNSTVNKVEVNQSVTGTSVSEKENKNDEKTEVKKVIKTAVEDEDKKISFNEFIRSKMEFLRKIITLQFLFGNK